MADLNRKEIPLPRGVEIVHEIGDNAVGIFTFSGGFPSLEIQDQGSSEFDEYVEQIQTYLSQEYPEVRLFLDQAPFIAEEFAFHILMQVILIHLLTEIQQDSLGKGDLELVDTINDPTSLLNIPQFAGTMDFDHFLRGFIANRGAKANPIHDSFPDTYFSLADIQLSIQAESQEISVADQDRQQFNIRVRDKLIKKPIEVLIAHKSTVELMEMAILSGSEILECLFVQKK